MIGSNGRVYGGTADGIFNPAAGDYSNAVVAEGLEHLSLLDYFLPPNWLYLNRKDSIWIEQPGYFGWRNKNLLAHGYRRCGLSFGRRFAWRERPSDPSLRLSQAGRRSANLL